MLKFHTWAHAGWVERNGSQFVLRLAVYSCGLLHAHCAYHTAGLNYVQCGLYRGDPYDCVHYKLDL